MVYWSNSYPSTTFANYHSIIMTSRSSDKVTTMKALEQEDGEASITSLCSSISSEEVRRQEEGTSSVLPHRNPSSRPIPLFQQEEKGRRDPLRPRRPRKQLKKKSFLSKWLWWRDRRNRRVSSRRKKESVLQQIIASSGESAGQQEQVLLWLFVLVVACAVIEIFLVNFFFFGRHSPVWGSSLPDVFEQQVVSTNASGGIA